jgi:MOSC domain-containing protein YiiM
MQLISLNVSGIKTFEYRGKNVTTGIYKTPIHEPVMLRRLNLDGDKQADLKVHGGVHKAVYFYPHEHYATWQTELGRDDFQVGQFGENFTVTGMLETEVYIGNIYRIGDAHVQISQPRVPCFKLAHKMQTGGDFQKQFIATGRTGYYARVIQEGMVAPDSPITLIEQDPQQVSIYAMNHLLYLDSSDVELARCALKIQALAPGWYGSMEEIVETYEENARQNLR